MDTSFYLQSEGVSSQDLKMVGVWQYNSWYLAEHFEWSTDLLQERNTGSWSEQCWRALCSLGSVGRGEKTGGRSTAGKTQSGSALFHHPLPEIPSMFKFLPKSCAVDSLPWYWFRSSDNDDTKTKFSESVNKLQVVKIKFLLLSTTNIRKGFFILRKDYSNIPQSKKVFPLVT